MPRLPKRNIVFNEEQSANLTYNSSRALLLVYIIDTVANLISLIIGGTYYNLFSSILPYSVTDYAMYMCGMYPPESYGAYIFPFWDKAFFTLAVVISVLIIGVYVFCLIMSRKRRYGWLIPLVILIMLDIPVQHYNYAIPYADMSLEIIFDIVIAISLILTIINMTLLYKLQGKNRAAQKAAGVPDIHADDDFDEDDIDEILDEAENQRLEDSVPLRMADMTVKYRTLLEHTEDGFRILYRRVGKTNELIIGGKVYDEYIARLEFAHNLNAVVSGHEIQAGFDGMSTSYIMFDNKVVARKTRLI